MATIKNEGGKIAAESMTPNESVTEMIVANRPLNDLGQLSLPQRPQISFIVLSFNNAEFLGDTLLSVAEQSYKDMEIVIADDGSTDQSPSLIHSFISSCPLPCLGILSARNGGIAQNYNSALTRVQADFIAHIGSDDINHPDRLKLQIDALMSTSASMCITGMQIMDQNSLKLRDAPARTDCHTIEDALTTGVVRVTSPTMMYRREIVDRFGLLPTGLANEDEALAFRAICSNGILVLRETLVRYRIHPNSVQADARSRNLSRHIRWLVSNLPVQIANRAHWKEILLATSHDESVRLVDALLSMLESKKALLATFPDYRWSMLLRRLLATADGRDILKYYGLQQIRNARQVWLQMRARLYQKCRS